MCFVETTPYLKFVSTLCEVTEFETRDIERRRWSQQDLQGGAKAKQMHLCVQPALLASHAIDQRGDVVEHALELLLDLVARGAVAEPGTPYPASTQSRQDSKTHRTLAALPHVNVLGELTFTNVQSPVLILIGTKQALE